MQHEILLAALGFPGDIIVENAEGVLHVAPGATFLSAAEREATNRVVRLGGHCRSIRDFVDTFSYLGNTGIGVSNEADPLVEPGQGRVLEAPSSRRKGSLYLQALCVGIDEVLTSYESAIAALEAEVIRDVRLPISHMLHRLGAFQVALPLLDGLCNRIVRRGVTGSRLLELLHSESKSGDTRVAHILNRLLGRTKAVFLHQLEMWVLQGQLFDPFSEFFMIERNAPRTSSFGAADEGTEDQSDDAEYEWEGKYELRLEAAPLLLMPASLATKAFFIGRAVRVLEKTRELKRGWSTRGALTDEETDEIAQRWEQLKGEDGWDLLSVEVALEDAYKIVAGRLSRLLLTESDGLFGALQVVREVFLLGRGDAFHSFIDDNRDALSRAPTPSSELELMAGLSTALWGPTDESRAHEQPALLHHQPQQQQHLSDRLWLVVNPPWFSTADFHNFAPAVLRFVGEVKYVRGAGMLRFGRKGGAAWTKGRKHAGGPGGFCSSFSFRFNGEAKAARLSFVVQDESAQTTPPVLSSRSRSGQNQVTDDDCGLSRALVVTLSINAGRPEAFMTVRLRRKELIRQSVKVSVPQMDASEMTVVCSHSVATNRTSLRVFFDDPERKGPPLMGVTLGEEGEKLPDLLGLGPEGGAFIGVDVSSGPCEIQTWSFGAAEEKKAAASGDPWPQELMQANKALEAQAQWRHEALQLEYRVGWPLQLVMTQEALTCYNRLFALLFRLRRLSHELERLWPLLMRCSREHRSLDQDLMKMLWALRSRMAYVIDGLVYYMQVDVIEGSFRSLLSDLSDAKDFESLCRLHRGFYHGLMSRCFLSPAMAAVRTDVESVVWLATRFAIVMDRALSAPELGERRDYTQALELEARHLMEHFAHRVDGLRQLLERSEAKELAVRLDAANGQSQQDDIVDDGM